MTRSHPRPFAPAAEPGNRLLGALLVTCFFIVLPMQVIADDVLAPARAALEAGRSELRKLDARVPSGTVLTDEQMLSRAELELRIGQPSSALALLDGLDTPEAKLIEARALLALHEYQRAGVLILDLGRRHPDLKDVLKVQDTWWTLTGDLGRLQDSVDEGSAAPGSTVRQRIVAAGMRLRLLDYAGALALYEELAATGLETKDRAGVLRDLGVTLHRLQDYEESLEVLRQALVLEPLDVHTINAIADTLLRLGRTGEAIDVLTFAVELSPTDRRAHQLLGAGYTDMSYTELYAAFPRSFADETGRARLAQADSALDARKPEAARQIYQELAAQHPGWADVAVRLGSLAYGQGEYREALEHFQRALTLCPAYGRAHAAYGRAVEALQLSVNVHFAADEAALADAGIPDIPRVEQFVLNWQALSERHQKRLALSLEPWAPYIPALIEGGATFYVKPLYQLLSDTPHNERLRDQRIDYDSRLWDDVRGIGGHATVVGIEDIETRIHNLYDTAIHELSHQVHAILSDDWQRKIRDLYAAAMHRQEQSGEGFLSQYAASSAWEYFAEGANALHNRIRDRFDTREIVLERLQVIDPPLLELVREIMHEADVGPSYAAALVSAGDGALWRGTIEEAEEAYRRALRRDPDNERALAGQIQVKVLSGRFEEARGLAESALSRHPSSGLIAVESADVLWLSSGDLDQAIALLEQRLPETRDSERYLVNEQLARLYLYKGDTRAARHAFASVLSNQPRDPDALAGLAEAEALLENRDEAWSYYDQALQIRSGSLGLRVRFARDLILAQDLPRAKGQVQSAALLSPSDPEVIALQAWLLLLEGEAGRARELAVSGYEGATWNTLAAISAAVTSRCNGNELDAKRLFQEIDGRFAPDSRPRYVYRNKGEGPAYELGYTASASDRAVAAAARSLTCGPGIEVSSRSGGLASLE